MGKTVGKYKKLSILVIGQGGREHALGWKLKKSPKVGKLYFAPGNGGTSELGENINIESEEIDKLAEFAEQKKIDLTVVGPEAPLAAGIVDVFTKKNLPVFGPNKSAAQLEASKAWAVEFMKRNKIPHPESHIFNNFSKALDFVRSSVWKNFVVKANGLAAGKGVVVCDSSKEAAEAIKRMMLDKEFGKAGDKIVIQEKLSGPEISVLAFTDGDRIIPLPPAQDHKRVFDNDQGPNTGGMGAYAPVPFVTKTLMKEIQKKILERTIEGLKKEGIIYMGVLYAGLMLTKRGIKVLEFNVRFGDPEIQPVIMLLSSDLVDILFSCINGNLSSRQVVIKKGSAVCVVLASGGYPVHYEKEKKISLPENSPKNIRIFHAGTKLIGSQLVTNGGRVLGVTGYASDLKRAAFLTYNFIEKQNVLFKGMHYRKDIGSKSGI